MQHGEFKVGVEFNCGQHRWRCTDVGSRVVIAIILEHDDDKTWYNGPPYAVLEHVLDENDQKGCTLP